ncbi:hypothetical protein RR21198_3992 [Rhodococcus rhodochrous ATCC 21198]|nr:hypothetical protein RR21198_3992 [Rhodococcus rhodochrous ATCC 21198]
MIEIFECLFPVIFLKVGCESDSRRTKKVGGISHGFWRNKDKLIVLQIDPFGPLGKAFYGNLISREVAIKLITFYLRHASDWLTSGVFDNSVELPSLL